MRLMRHKFCSETWGNKCVWTLWTNAGTAGTRPDQGWNTANDDCLPQNPQMTELDKNPFGLHLEHPWLHHLLIRSLHHTTKLRTHSERFSQISFLTQKPWHFMSEICFAILTILQEQGASMKDICSHLISQDDGIHNEQHEQLAKCVASSNEFEQFGIGRLSWPLCLRIMLCANQRI